MSEISLSPSSGIRGLEAYGDAKDSHSYSRFGYSHYDNQEKAGSIHIVKADIIH
ncbi:MAG: hypothetical protein ACR2IS_09890 [Nitrososphaeraceae archaeon]